MSLIKLHTLDTELYELCMTHINSPRDRRGLCRKIARLDEKKGQSKEKVKIMLALLVDHWADTWRR